MCPCRKVAYCSAQCAVTAWDAYHSEVCTYVEPIGARTDTRLQSLFEMLQDANQPESEYKNLFGRIYSLQRYNYITLHYDRCRKPIMLLDSRGDVGIAVLSSIQRLWRDYFGPWTGSRMAVLKLPPGFGKTAMGHLLWANYKYEAVQLPEVPHETKNFTGPLTLPRMPIWITRPTLIHTVSEDLWAQDDQNPADIKKKITDNGGLVTERGTAFNKDRLVMSYAQFENILQGRSAAGRKLWAGFKLTDNVSVSAMETYNGVPTAFRRVDGRWVRGNASHDIDNTTELRNIELRFLSRLDVATLEKIRRMIANDFDPIINQWKRFTWKVGERKHVLPLALRRAIKNVAAVEVVNATTLSIVVRWKSRDPDSLPSVELWERWVANGFRPFAAYRRLQTHYKGELDAFAIHTEPLDTPTRGWKLGKTLRGAHASRTGREVLSWVPLESGEREIDFNPLDRVTLIIDEAHNIFESELIRAALKDAKNVVVVNMSASLDLFTGLRVLDNSLPNTENPSETALGPARNFPTDLPHLSADIRTYDELKSALTEKYFDPETNDFTPAFEELANAFKGVISVANISEMRDIFAEAVYPETQRLDVRLSAEHAKRVHSKIMEAIEMGEREPAPDTPPQLKRHTMAKWVEPVQNTISIFTDDLHDRYILASKTFRKEVTRVASTLIYGHNPVFPAAKVLLRTLRQLDEEEFARTGKLTKRMIVSSTKDHKYGIIPSATSMQAAGYEWLPVELQQPDLAKLSTRARNRLRENRRLGVKIESQLRKVKIASEPMTIHSEGVEIELQPFSDRKQFVVLSEELINRLLLASVEEPSFDSIVQDVLDDEPPSLRTAYKFHSTKGKFRQGAPEAEVFEAFATADAERSPAVEELLSRIMGKRLYLWPGYREEMEDWKSLQSVQMKVLLQIQDPQPFFFVRTQRSIIKLGKEIVELNITEEQEPLALAWPREGFNPGEKRNVHDFNVLLGWVEPAKSLSEDTKKDAQDTILEVANEIANITGKNVRFILLGEGFLEGINVKGITAVIEAEGAVTHESSLQRRGRAIRRCGHEGLPFDEWKVAFYTVVHSVPEEFKIEASFFAEEDEDWPVEIEEIPTQRAPKGESEEAKKRRLAVTRARVKEESAQRQFAFRQLSALSSIGAEPVDWKTTAVKGRSTKAGRVGATPILDSTTTLEPYQAVRMLHEDPRVTLVRLRGEQLFDEWALDRGHNTLRTKTTSTVRLNTNYMLRIEAVTKLMESMDTAMQLVSGTALDRLRERRDGLFELWNNLPETKTVPLIHREIAEKDDKKTLYILLKNKTVDLRGELFTDKPPTELLGWLVAHNYAQWATIVEPIGTSQLIEGVAEEESILVGSGIEDIGTPDEEQEAIERATMANVFRILYALGIEWNLETTSLLWPEAEQPDPDQSLADVHPTTATTEELRRHEKSIFQQLFADDGESVRRVPLKRVVKRAILDVYRYGVMNWFRGAALLAHILRVRDTDKYWVGSGSGDQTSKTLTEAQLKRASTLVGTLFRLASAPDIVPYLEQLRALGVARNDNDFDQKAAIILASARWFDEIVIKRKASETKTKQGSLGLPLLGLSTILSEVQSLGINLNLHIDAVLEPLVRSPRALVPYPTSIGELESQIRKKKPRPMLTTDTGEDANRLFQLYVKYDRNLTEAWEDISWELAKRNTIVRALKLTLPTDNSTENINQQIENIVTTNLEAIKITWPEAQPYPAAIVVSALLRAFAIKAHFVSNSSNPARLERHLKALESFMKVATERLEVKTDELRKFLKGQKTQKKAEELQQLQDRPTRVTGFHTVQRVLNKTDGVGVERTERKATDVIPMGESVPVEELLEEDGIQRTGTLLIRIDPSLASKHKIQGGLLQSLTADQSSIVNLVEMWVDDLVKYTGTKPLERRFFERLTTGVADKFVSETKTKLAQDFTEKGIRKLIDELLKPDNNSLLQAIFTNRSAASFLKLLQFADVGSVVGSMQILEQHSRLTDEFIEEFNGTTPVASLTKRINRFCNNCNLNDIKHLVVNPVLYRNFPYYTQAEWDAQHGTGVKKGKTKKEDPKTLRSNANILRITVILYHEKTPDGGRYGSYRMHVTAIRRTVAKISPELIHKKIPGQTMIDNPAFKRKSQVVNAAFQEAIRERSEKFLQDYQ